MDHRNSVRLPLRVAVEVIKQRRFLGRFVTRNLDVEGAYIEMRTTAIEPNDVVELIFVVPVAELCEYPVTAGVVRLDADGAGVMLCGHETNMLDVIRAAKSADYATCGRQPIAPWSSS